MNITRNEFDANRQLSAPCLLAVIMRESADVTNEQIRDYLESNGWTVGRNALSIRPSVCPRRGWLARLFSFFTRAR
jgi:hypothetical protein